MSVVVNHGNFVVRSKSLTSHNKIGPGRLVLVVGPSGSGKDTLLRGAARQLAGDASFVFPRRAVTRPSDPGSEDHDTLTKSEFATIKQTGKATFWWEAHGHGYVIPLSVEADVKAGKTVVFNASRSIISKAQHRFSAVAVVHISVPDEVLRSRIENRGRETEAEIVKRLSRADVALPTTNAGFEITNVGPVEDGVSQLVGIVSGRRLPEAGGSQLS